MPSPIKSTYALDRQTVRALEVVARRWGVSKSEALRRAVREAAATSGDANEALEARGVGSERRAVSKRRVR